jgi:hypothetical protein
MKYTFLFFLFFFFLGEGVLFFLFFSFFFFLKKLFSIFFFFSLKDFFSIYFFSFLFLWVRIATNKQNVRLVLGSDFGGAASKGGGRGGGGDCIAEVGADERVMMCVTVSTDL